MNSVTELLCNCSVSLFSPSLPAPPPFPVDAGCMPSVAGELADRQCPSGRHCDGEPDDESSGSGCLLASIDADMPRWSAS